jgi:hypothetical protein
LITDDFCPSRLVAYHNHSDPPFANQIFYVVFYVRVAPIQNFVVVDSVLPTLNQVLL